MHFDVFQLMFSSPVGLTNTVYFDFPQAKHLGLNHPAVMREKVLKCVDDIFVSFETKTLTFT